MAGDSEQLRNQEGGGERLVSAGSDLAAIDPTEGHLSWIRQGLASESPRHRVVCNRGKERFEPNNSGPDRCVQRLWPDNRI